MPPPIIAPAKRVGANRPPGVPDAKQNEVSAIFASARMNSVCQLKRSWRALSMVM